MKNQNIEVVNQNEEVEYKARKGAPLSRHVLGADIGNGYIKVVYSNSISGTLEKFMLETGVDINREDEKVEDTMYINGVPHNLSCKDKTVTRGYLTKDNEYTMVNMYRAMYEVARRTGFTTKKFVIGLGSSLDTYKDKEEKEKFRARALENKKVKIEHKGKIIELEIEDVIVQPETVSSIYNIKNFDKNEITYIVDLGTQNSQIVKYYKGVVWEETRPRDYGYQSILEGLQDEYRKSGKALDTDRISVNIEKGRDKKLINNYVIDSFLKGVITNELKKMKADLEYDQIVFVGGTSERFREQILKVFKNAKFSEDPVFSNAIGMYMRTMATLKKREQVEKEQKKSSQKEGK